jgi:hypothetical protein
MEGAICNDKMISLHHENILGFEDFFIDHKEKEKEEKKEVEEFVNKIEIDTFFRDFNNEFN